MTTSTPFVVVWEFRLQSDCAARFEAAYGSQGPWVQLFRQNPNFLRTELQRDLDDPLRYWTLDYWISEADYNQFRIAHAADYRRIDVQCEQLTVDERELGRFTVLAS